MNSYWNWWPRYKVMTDQPGPRDVALLVFADGKRVGMFPVADYERVLANVRQLAEVAKAQVKLLPVTGQELLGFLGTTAAKLGAGRSHEHDAWDRHLVVNACTEALQKSDDPGVRKDAYDMLVSLEHSA